MKDSFKSSSVMGLNWIYESDSLPESTSWKMPPVDEKKWAFERSRDTVAARIFVPLRHFRFRFKIKQQLLSGCGGENKVFDVLSDCKDKTAHPTHSAAPSVFFFFVFFWVGFCFSIFLILFFFSKGLSSQVALAISISWNYHFTCLQGPYRWLMWNCH